MGVTPADQTAPAHYTNGLDLHFDYNGDTQQISTAKRKKKKKKKKGSSNNIVPLTDSGTSASNIPLSAVDIWDPDEPYPNNRVIKVAKNGDLIVEPIYDEDDEDEADEHSNNIPITHNKDLSKDENPTFLDLPGNLERSMFHFKDEQEREFWNSLSFPERQKILDIDMEMMMNGVKLTARTNNHKSSGHNHKSGWGCLCSNCGQNIANLREEMDFATVPYMSDFLESTWNMTRSKPEKPNPSRDFFMKWLSTSENRLRSQISAGDDLEAAKSEALGRLEALTNAREHGNFGDYFKMYPHVYAAVNESSHNKDSTSKPFPTQFLDQLYRYTNEGKAGVPKVLEFLKTQLASDDMANKLSKDIADSMSEFADLLLNGEKQFVDMVEVIKKRENEIESTEVDDENDKQLKAHLKDEAIMNVNKQAHKLEHEEANNHSLDHFHDHSHNHSHSNLHTSDDSAYNLRCSHHHESTPEHDHDGDLQHSDESDYEDEDHEYDPAEHEQERIEELRGLFMIQAVHLIRKRFRVEFEKKVSEDRTKQFIQELEAEESAKKERELKKLRQKEENKEKKRLQQKAHEDEKKKRLDAEREKAAALKQQQEAVRAEQLRRKEELRLKKLHEKEKKIEALKKKEQEKKEYEKLERERKELERKEAEKKEKERLEIQKKEMEEQRKEKERREKVQASLKANNAIMLPSIPMDTKPLRNGFIDNPSSAMGQELSFNPVELPPNAQFPVSLESVSAPSPTVSAAQGAQTTITPATNHLLEQLYHAQPRISIGSVSATDGFDSMLTQPPAPQSQPTPPTATVQHPPPMDFWASDYLRQSMPPLHDSQGGTLWSSGYRRSSSIWGNSAGLQTWGSTPVFGTASTVPSSIPSSSAAGISAPQSGLMPQPLVHGQAPLQPLPSLQQNMQPSLTSPLQSLQQNLSQPLINTSNQTAFGLLDLSREPIQRAAMEAFQMLQLQNQLQFGAAGAHSLFLVSKGILQRPDLLFSEFLRLLHSPIIAVFDLVYDDFGSVTHIKITPNELSPKMANGGTEPMPFTNENSFDQPKSVFNIQNLQVPDFGYEFKDEDLLKRQIW